MKQPDRKLRSLAVGRRFLPQLAEHRWALLVVAGAALAAAGLEVLRPWPVKWIVDGVLVPGPSGGGDPLPIVAGGALAALAIAVSKAGVEFLGTLRQAHVSHLVTRALRIRIFAHLTELPLAFHARNKSGDLLVRLMGDVPMLRTMLVDSSVALLSRLLLIVGTLGTMLAVDAPLTLAVLAIVPVLLLVVRLFSTRITVATRKQRRKEGVLADFLHEAVAGVAVIQALGRGPHTVHRFARGNRTTARAELKSTRLAAHLSFSVESLLGCVLAGTLGLGSWRVLEGHLSAGELLVFLSYVRGLLKPVRAAARHGERIAKGTACGERLLQILDEEVTVTSAPGAPPAPRAPSTLAFDGVHFAYPGGEPVLRGLDVTFRAGELTGLFGSSGAGKSTTVALALRLVDPRRGAVLLDGVDVRTVDLDSLRARFGVCLQETTLFGESVRENLLLGDPGADDARLWAALEDAGAASFVRALPDGLETVLSREGGGLSGGQRRRLSLARTFLRDAPVLLVDEPFAGLDRRALEHTREALRQRARRGPVIVICHEREHLEDFDRVVFLDGGVVVDAGPHEVLARRCTRYGDVLTGRAVELGP